MSNTILRGWITHQQSIQLRAMMRGFLVEGDLGADLLDEVHAMLRDSSWRRIGSGDLEAVADTMRADCLAFAEREIEQHELEQS